MLGDGYLGYSHLSAQNALYIGDAIEVLHSFGGWQLHDNYFGAPGGTNAVTGDIDSVEFQYMFSFGQLFWYPKAFWGQGPDLIASVFGMFNHVDAPQNLPYDGINKVKVGRRGDVPAAGLVRRRRPLRRRRPRLRQVGHRARRHRRAELHVALHRALAAARVPHRLRHPRADPRAVLALLRTPAPAAAMFPYNIQTGAGQLSGSDANAFQIAAIIWF